METFASGKIKRLKNKHAPQVSQQTGFPSAATHYTEQRISLDNELVTNSDATFFVRIVGDEFLNYNITHGDVLIIDRSLAPVRHSLVLLVKDGAFAIARVSEINKKNACWVWGVITYVIHDVR